MTLADRIHLRAGTAAGLFLVLLWHNLPSSGPVQYIIVLTSVAAIASGIATGLARQDARAPSEHALLGALSMFASLSLTTVFLVIMGLWTLSDLLSILIAPFAVAGYAAVGVMAGAVALLIDSPTTAAETE